MITDTLILQFTRIKDIVTERTKFKNCSKNGFAPTPFKTLLTSNDPLMIEMDSLTLHLFENEEDLYERRKHSFWFIRNLTTDVQKLL